MKRSIKVMIGFVGFLIVLGAIANIPMQSSSQEKTQDNDIGRTYIHNDLSITLNSAKKQSFYVDDLDDRKEAPEGREFLIVNVTAINEGHKEKSVGCYYFDLFDEYGNKFSSLPIPPFYAHPHDPFTSGDLYYNEKVEGNIGYRIPKNNGRLILKYTILESGEDKYVMQWII